MKMSLMQMNAKFFGFSAVLSALLGALPMATVAALSMATPAAAIAFNGGDILNITGDYKAPAPTNIYRFRTVGGSNAALGSYGNFGVQNASTGGFSAFANNGTVQANYDILSLNFNDVASYLGFDFLRLNNGGDAFSFVITEPVTSNGSFSTGSSGGSIYSFKGLFKNADGQELGEGILTGQFVGGSNGSYSASLVVKSVPEPSALLGTGLMVGAIYVVRRGKLVAV
jgi:hypothetical protein